MKHPHRIKLENGFSMVELMISMCILIPVMGAAVGMFSVGAKQNATEQSSIDANQEARSAFEMMTTEIHQACSHGDVSTTLQAGVPNSTTPVPAILNCPSASCSNAAAGFNVGDYVDIDTGTNHEIVQITAVGTHTISAAFRVPHDAGAAVRLFAVPYTNGVIAPGIGPNSSMAGQTLRFYGNINGDSTVQYIEYAYNAATNEITRSSTPVTQTTLNPPVVLVRNVAPNSAQFTVTSDSLGVVTSATIAMTVRNAVKDGSRYQETELASKVTIPSAMAASVLLDENRRFGGFNRIPPHPAEC